MCKFCDLFIDKVKYDFYYVSISNKEISYSAEFKRSSHLTIMQTNKRGKMFAATINFFIAFYISFPFLIVALEIASSSIVADGACLKKKTNRGKDWNRNKPEGENSRRAAFSFAMKSSERSFSLELFSGFGFSGRKTRNFCCRSLLREADL